ncbi:MAG TPA: hypothetical protein DHW42_00930, partial [Candidatus Marinimicrobia bacterium]|nr:hypothetical protein [Candidatus Neomarinimicrobiota bacterium]
DGFVKSPLAKAAKFFINIKLGRLLISHCFFNNFLVFCSVGVPAEVPLWLLFTRPSNLQFDIYETI